MQVYTAHMEHHTVLCGLPLFHIYGCIIQGIASFAVGYSGHSYKPPGMDYLTERNYNTEQDTSILSLSEKTNAIYQNLLSDPVLARLHHASLVWRHAQFDRLMQQEPMRALLGRMMVTPQTQPISPENAAVLVKYAQNAQNDS